MSFGLAMTERSDRQHKRRSLRAALSVAVVIAVLASGQPLTAEASTASSYNFDTEGDLAELFYGVGVGTGVASVTQALDGGINNSGSIAVPLSSVNAVFTTKESYSLGPTGSKYQFSTYIKSEGNAGYSGVGFTTASPASASFNTAYRPDNAFGISVHGGGFIFHNGNTNYSGDWRSSSNFGIETIQQSLCHDLINNTTACGSPAKVFSHLLYGRARNRHNL